MKKQNSILEIKGLLKQIDNEDTLHSVNLNFKSGRVYGLLGPNGAGKTTLMKCVLSLSRVNGGKIVFDGEEITNGQN
ncbi:ATP-binding cassette domain-containing protein, partial [Clostridioides difficile]|uniref:ATP-binding cassette domain-containing protein n=1 Tax=Clostridioides difficile TaxID=1496 RepID=UPI00235A096E